jgi:hypothetical protein
MLSGKVVPEGLKHTCSSVSSMYSYGCQHQCQSRTSQNSQCSSCVFAVYLNSDDCVKARQTANGTTKTRASPWWRLPSSPKRHRHQVSSVTWTHTSHVSHMRDSVPPTCHGDRHHQIPFQTCETRQIARRTRIPTRTAVRPVAP